MANDHTRIIGTYISPYVRKVLVCLALKRISYEIVRGQADAHADCAPSRRLGQVGSPTDG